MGGLDGPFETVGDAGLASFGVFDEDENFELRLDIHELFRAGEVGGLALAVSFATFAIGWADVSPVSGLERLRNRLECRPPGCSAGMLSGGDNVEALFLCCSPLALGDDEARRVPGETDLSAL